jgi:hypothetical protein
MFERKPQFWCISKQRKDMRRAFAIVFSLLLVIGQWASAMPSAPQRLATACKACTCQKMSCCVAPASAPTAPQAPATESRSTEQQQLVTALATITVALAEPISTRLPAGKVTLPVTAPPTVPLYCQNCTFLI